MPVLTTLHTSTTDMHVSR